MKSKIVPIVVTLLLTRWFNFGLSHEISPEKNKQLKSIFSEASAFTEKHLKLTDAQSAQIEKIIRGKLNPKHKNPTIYLAESNEKGKPLGYVGFFDAKEPDGDIVPGAVGVKPDGAIAKIIIFTHHANENPVAGESFLGQFVGKKVDDPHLWHPDHLIKMMKGHEAASSAAHKAIHRTSAIIAVGAGLKKLQVQTPRKNRK